MYFSGSLLSCTDMRADNNQNVERVEIIKTVDLSDIDACNKVK